MTIKDVDPEGRDAVPGLVEHSGWENGQRPVFLLIEIDRRDESRSASGTGDFWVSLEDDLLALLRARGRSPESAGGYRSGSGR